MFSMFKNFVSKPSVQMVAKEIIIGIASGTLGHVIITDVLDKNRKNSQEIKSESKLELK